MNRQTVATLLLALLPMPVAAHADYAYAMAGVRVVGSPRSENEHISPDKVGAAVSFQNGFGHSGSSTALSLGSSLVADMFTHADQAGFAEAYASVSSSGSEVIVHRRDGAADASIVTVTALVTPKLAVTFGGSPASWDQPFMYGNIQWGITVIDGNGNTQSLNGQSTDSMAYGRTGDATGVPYALTFQVRSGVAFSLALSMSAFTESSSSFPSVGTGTATISTAELKLGGAAQSLMGDGPTMAFILPEGYTADSEHFGIVDNVITTPAPGALSLLGAAGLVGRRRPR